MHKSINLLIIIPFITANITAMEKTQKPENPTIVITCPQHQENIEKLLEDLKKVLTQSSINKPHAIRLNTPEPNSSASGSPVNKRKIKQAQFPMNEQQIVIK